NRDGELLQTIPMDQKCFEQIVSCVEKFPAYIRFCTTGKDIVLTEEEDLEQKLLEETRLFFPGNTDEEILESDQLQQLLRRMCRIGSVEELRKMNTPIHKEYINAKTGEIIQEIWKDIEKIPGIAIAASFFNNQKLTAEKAQKGHAISRHIEKLGYGKEE